VPEDWLRHYMAQNYQAVDPVLLRAPLASRPLVWNDMLTGGRLSPKQRRVFLESREASLFDGVSIPLHGPCGETYVVSLAAERAGMTRAVDLDHLQLLAVQFLLSYSHARRLHAAAPSTICITDRERECLTWTARGKSAWTIGKILDISEHTVNFHLKRSMAKLGATNRMQAIVSALRLGLILP
jgi:LuxR family quorum-sensing system transcriptional regulator CciR